MSFSFASETSSKFPTEQECQQFVRDNRYYGGITIGSFSDETLQQLGEIFSQNRRPLTLKGIYKKWIESHPDSSLTPFKLYQLLTLWEEYPNSYFQFGRIWKKYPVGKNQNQHTYQTKSTLDYFTKFGGKIVYKKESRLKAIFNGLKINTTLALIGAIVAEFFGTPIVGMGFRISVEAQRMSFDLVWAEITMAAIVGSTLYGLLALLERYLTFWHPSFHNR